jgi:hypothetical protein
MADQTLTINGKQAAAGSGVLNVIPPDYISGLKMVWVSGTAITLTSGAACRPSDSFLMQASTDIAKTGLSLTASTWYHIYLFLNAGVADIEIVTTVPASPYSGTARAKTGDTSRRYVGSVRTDAAGSIYRILHNTEMNRISYVLTLNNAFLQLLISVSSTSGATVSCAAQVPLTATHMSAFMENRDTSGSTYLGSSVVGSPASTNPVIFIRQLSMIVADIILDNSLAFIYQTTGTGMLTCYPTGYVFER